MDYGRRCRHPTSMTIATATIARETMATSTNIALLCFFVSLLSLKMTSRMTITMTAAISTPDPATHCIRPYRNCDLLPPLPLPRSLAAAPAPAPVPSPALAAAVIVIASTGMAATGATTTASSTLRRRLLRLRQQRPLLAQLRSTAVVVVATTIASRTTIMTLHRRVPRWLVLLPLPLFTIFVCSIRRRY